MLTALDDTLGIFEIPRDQLAVDIWHRSYFSMNDNIDDDLDTLIGDRILEELLFPELHLRFLGQLEEEFKYAYPN